MTTPPDLAAMRCIYDALNHDDIPKDPGGAALFIAEAIHDTGLAFTWEADIDGLTRQESKGARAAARKTSTTKSQAKADETDEEAMT